MARVFTTTFPYRGSTYTAIVTQVDGSINIRVTDRSFEEVLYIGQLTYHHDHGLAVEGLSYSQDLIRAVLSAIDGKVQLSPNPSAAPQQTIMGANKRGKNRRTDS